MAVSRVTITLDEDLLERARQAGNANFSRFVADALEDRLEQMRRQELRDSLIAGCAEDADLNLSLCREWDGALRDGLEDDAWED